MGVAAPRGMKTSVVALSVAVALGACATDAPVGRDTSSDDTVDPDAKTDAAKPVGIYTLIDPDSFEEGYPRMEHLDLRRDGTFYIYEIGPVDNNGNFEEGYNSYFGTYTLNKDRYGNKYLRVKNDGSSWRYKYKVAANGELDFFYRDGSIGWRMKHEADPTAAHLKRIRAVFEAGTNRRKLANRTSSSPDAVWSHYYEVQDAGNYGVYTLSVDGDVHYMLLGDSSVEIYAANNQLLASATKSQTWKWNEELF